MEETGVTEMVLAVATVLTWIVTTLPDDEAPTIAETVASAFTSAATRAAILARDAARSPTTRSRACTVVSTSFASTITLILSLGTNDSSTDSVEIWYASRTLAVVVVATTVGTVVS